MPFPPRIATRSNHGVREGAIARDDSRLLVTIHPSYLLRIEDEADKAREYERFVADLRVCARLLKKAA